MPSVRKRSKKGPAPTSAQAARAIVEEQRIRRELARMQRITQLARRLERETGRADVGVLDLSRALVFDRGWTVVDSKRNLEQWDELKALRVKVAELEGLDYNALRRENDQLRARLIEVGENLEFLLEEDRPAGVV